MTLEATRFNLAKSEPVAIGMDLLYQRVDTMSQISAAQVGGHTLLAHYLNNTTWLVWDGIGDVATLTCERRQLSGAPPLGT